MRPILVLAFVGLSACSPYELVDPNTPPRDVSALVEIQLVQEDTARYDVSAFLARAPGQAAPSPAEGFLVDGVPMQLDREDRSATSYRLTVRRAPGEALPDSMRVRFPVFGTTAPFETAIAVPRRDGPLDVPLTGGDLVLRLAGVQRDTTRTPPRATFWQLELHDTSCDSPSFLAISGRTPVPSEMRVPAAWLANSMVTRSVACLDTSTFFELPDAPYRATIGTSARIVWHIQRP